MADCMRAVPWLVGVFSRMVSVPPNASDQDSKKIKASPREIMNHGIRDTRDPTFSRSRERALALRCLLVFLY